MTNEITISTNDSDIRSMLIKLMGRGMTLSQTVHGQFTLSLDDVLDLINKIVQRVSLQNHTRMSDFHAEFGFQDGSRDGVPSYEALKLYRSVNPTICNSCKISFAFLIDFQGRGVEKQALDIEITCQEKEQAKSSQSLILFDEIVVAKLDIRIEYTDITWANDIKNLFEKYCDVHVRRFKYRHKIAGFLNIKTIPMLLFPFAFVGALIAETRTSQERIIKKLGAYLQELNNTDQLNSINKKLDLLILKENDVKTVFDILPSILMITSLVTLSVLISAIIRNVPISAIIISPEAKKIYEREERRRDGLNRFFYGGVLLAVVVSLMSANIDRILMKLWAGT